MLYGYHIHTLLSSHGGTPVTYPTSKSPPPAGFHSCFSEAHTRHVPGLGIAQRAAQEQPRSGGPMLPSRCQPTLRPPQPPAPSGADRREGNSLIAPLTSPALPRDRLTSALIPHNPQVSRLTKKQNP